MLSRELDEAITILRADSCWGLCTDEGFTNKLADLLLVCAAQGDVIQAVAETVARSIITTNKGDTGKVELRDA
ncbi:MAG: hypothetical protein EBT26_02680 [Microbacteriaceae bacterium]|nr:hypothetical protein [Microbacteriaceae bacterium]NBS60947.1 hypothetical protein [Microbacteriaceae bacterium]